MTRTWVVLLGLVAMVLAGCGAARTGPDVEAEPEASGVEEPPEPLRATSEGCDEVDFYWEEESCEPARSIPLDDVVSGGPPPDGIPPLDEPRFESVEQAATWLDDDSPVMVVELDGEVRAYPLAILTWHEIVNDRIADVPVVVTYCPLCNSALAFERTVSSTEGDTVLDFSTTGRLYRSNLLMYDRQTHTIWTQFDGQGVIGEQLLGARLERLPAWLLGFGEVADAHPDAEVLSRDTGHDRNYGRNPYPGYDNEGLDPFLFEGEIDERFPAMARVVGIEQNGDALAITHDLLVEQGVVTDTVGGVEVVVLWASGQASALDSGTIDAGRDVGQTGAFVAELDGTPVELEPEDGRFLDVRSGTTFNVLGEAVDGPHEGASLEPVIHDDTFWFVWSAFREQTRVLEP